MSMNHLPSGSGLLVSLSSRVGQLFTISPEEPDSTSHDKGLRWFDPALLLRLTTEKHPGPLDTEKVVELLSIHWIHFVYTRPGLIS